MWSPMDWLLSLFSRVNDDVGIPNANAADKDDREVGLGETR